MTLGDFSRMPRMAGLVVLLTVGAACDAPETPAAAGADLSTTESSPPYAAWALDSVPTVRIGAAEGTPEYQFSRIGHAARLSDGRTVVYDGASSELRWFDPEGRFLFHAGGRGEGPGELLGVVAVAVTPEDQVVLYDFRNQRLTWFGPDGSLLRGLRLDLQPAVTLASFGDGRLVIAEERATLNLGGEEFNYARDSILVMVADGAQPLDTIMDRAGREAATWVAYTDGAPTGIRQFGLPFGHPTLVGATDDEIVLVDDRHGELAFFDTEGDGVRLALRTDLSPRILSDGLREEHVRHAVRRARDRGLPAPPAADGARGLLDEVPPDTRVAWFDRMLTDPVSGRVWLRDYVVEWGEDEARHWTVHDATGRVLARVTTPPAMEVMQVTPDHVVGVERDEVGVEYVVAFALNGVS